MQPSHRSTATATAALLSLVVLVSAAAFPAVAASADPPPAAGACETLIGLKLDHGEIDIARLQAAKAPVEGARLPGMTGNPAEGPPVGGLPAFCRVAGRLHPEAGSDVRFEVWMPSEGWDGRLDGLGTGGFAGSIDYLTLGLALRAGQAGMSTDTGHQGTSFDSAWAKGHPERVRDYGWRAMHVSTVAAKRIVAGYYGRAQDHAYFIGCSNGGRQALMEASRFPEDYDGVVAGAPAALWSHLALSVINAAQAQAGPGAAIRRDQVHLLQDEVLRQCDALDGQADGLVADPRRCPFDTSRLACGVSSSSQCFSPAQLTALGRIYAGAHDTAGRRLTPGYLPSGSEAGNPSPALGWDGYLLTGPSGRPQGAILVGGLLDDLVQGPFHSPETFDFDTDPARLTAAVGPDLDVKPDLGRFFDRGGKLIVWHGWADAVIPPEATVELRTALLRESGRRAPQSMRVFMVPSVQHCMGGTGPAAFGQLNPPLPGDTPERSMAAAMQAWVETGRAPESLIGRRGFGGVMGMADAKPERQRLLCAYPAEAVLTPGADPDRAASYTCRAETRAGATHD